MQDLFHVIEQVGLDQLGGRDVDGDEDRFGGAIGALPDAKLAAGLIQHGAADVTDHAGLLGKPDETLGRQQAEVRMAPAHQRLEAREMHVGKAGDGLVVNFDLVALDGAAQFLLEDDQLGAVILHRRIEQLDRARAVALGFVECDGRVLHDLLGGHGGIAQVRKTNRGGEEIFLVVERDRAGYRFQKRFGEVPGIPRLNIFMEQNGELVAGQPGNRIGVAGFGLQPAANHGKQRIARIMAHRVIDHLEAVEVDQQHEQIWQGFRSRPPGRASAGR